MSNYSKGYQLERRVSAHLREEGYETIESRGSHGVADIWAAKVGELLVVQVKANGVLGPEDWNALFTFAAVCEAVPLLACRDGRKLRFWQLLATRQPYVRNLPRELWTADRVAA